MTLERRLQINLAIMTSLGSLLLAVAEQEPRLAILAAVISGTSVYFADVKGWIVLNSLGSNVAGVAALGLTLWHWHSMESELLFIALANFLTYLQCVLHYRGKALHVYGMLMLLSFLQMAVAAVLASTLVFGCVFVAYLWAMLRTFALFSIFREQQEATRGAARPFHDTLTVAEFFVTPLNRLVGMLWQGVRGHDVADDSHPSTAARWPLTDRPNQFVRRRQLDDDQVTVNGLGWQMAKFGLLTLPLTAVIFTVIPRAGQQRETGGGTGAVALTGFSELVTLQDVARIQENPEEVMRIRLFDYHTGRPYELSEQPWLRGSALGRYGWGSWKPEEWPGVRLVSLDEAVPPVRDALPDARENDLVRFEVTLEPIRTSTVVFTLEPAHRVPGPAPSNLRREGATHEHYRPRNRRRSVFTYEMLTTGLKNGRQVPFRAQDEPYAWEQKTELLEPFASFYVPADKLRQNNSARDRERRQEAIRTQRERLQGLANEAAKVLEGAGLDAGRNPREAALALERFLQSEGGFTYSLNPPPAKQGLAEADPVNQFVVEVKKGHCEYFASALALMLRSQGIPSRVVVGYKGGQWNAVGGYYEVRQQEAHAWVEAWVFADGRPLGWLRLDPTPSDEMTVLPMSSSLVQLKNYLIYLWSRYILGMDANLQEDLFQPLAALFQRETWRGVLHWLWKAVLGQTGDSGMAFSWRIAAFAIGVQLALVAMYRLLRRLVKRIRTVRSRQSRRQGSIPHVDFYVRLERLLARCGLCRRESQTPREFASASAGALAAGSLTMAAAPLLPSIVEAYYRVRFGGPPLSHEERERLSDELTRLEAIVFESHRDGNGDAGHGGGKA